MNCYFNSSKTEDLFFEITSNQSTDFSRYNYFYASYLADIGKVESANSIINEALKHYPRNLLLNQYRVDLKNNNVRAFDCKKKNMLLRRYCILQLTHYPRRTHSLSNFYLNLAKFLMKIFSYDTLAENFYKTNNYIKAKKIYNNLSQYGEAFNWYSSKQLKIYIKTEKKMML